MGAMPHAGGPMGPGACVFGCPLGPAHSSVLGPVAWSLNLTDEQIKKIRGIYDQARADADSVDKAVATATIGLHEAITSGATEAQIRTAATTLGTAIGNQAALHAKTLAAARTVLTEEQRKELERIPEKMSTLRHNPEGPNPAGGVGQGGTVPHSGSIAPASGRSMTLDQMFKDADTNNDGVLTLNELNAFQGKMGGQIRHQ
jgi:Spy/CpxP family protein refolding chaperone